MDVLELMQKEEEAILTEALQAVAWLEHYERDGDELALERLSALFRMVADAVRTRDLEGLVSHATRIARERHAAGYRRAEVLSAVSALEEAIWHRALVALPAADQAWALGLVGTVVTHAREALAEAFAELSRSTPAAHVDLSPLFRGAGRRAGDRFTEDMVYPV